MKCNLKQSRGSTLKEQFDRKQNGKVQKVGRVVYLPQSMPNVETHTLRIEHRL